MTRTPSPNPNALPAPQGVTPALDLAYDLENLDVVGAHTLDAAAKMLRDQSATIEALRGALRGVLDAVDDSDLYSVKEDRVARGLTLLGLTDFPQRAALASPTDQPDEPS